MFEDGLDAPEAASGKNRGLLALGSGQRRIYGRRGEGHFLGLREASSQEHGKRSSRRGQQSQLRRCRVQYRGSAWFVSLTPVLVYSLYAGLDADRWVLDGGRFAVIREFPASSPTPRSRSGGMWNRAFA